MILLLHEILLTKLLRILIDAVFSIPDTYSLKNVDYPDGKCIAQIYTYMNVRIDTHTHTHTCAYAHLCTHKLEAVCKCFMNRNVFFFSLVLSISLCGVKIRKNLFKTSSHYLKTHLFL